MKVSRVIVIVVALHVLVIGGIFVFEGCSRTRVQSPQMAENETMPGTLPDNGFMDPSTDPLMTGMQPAGPGAVLPTTATGTGPDYAMAPQSALPTAAVAPQMAPAAVAAPTTYTVKRGDSLWKISRNEGVTVSELAQANSIGKNSLLQIGQVLTIPAKPQVIASAAPAAVPTASITSAAVAGFDSGSSIATGGGSYTVKSGDSLWKIARANGTTVAALKQANNLSGDMLQIGQQLILPGSDQQRDREQRGADAGPGGAGGDGDPGFGAEWHEPGRMIKENGQQYHVVDWNESLGAIAQKHGVTVQQLKQANNLSNVQIHPGQRLLIPARATTVSMTDTSLATPIVNTSPTTIE